MRLPLRLIVMRVSAGGWLLKKERGMRVCPGPVGGRFCQEAI